MFSSRLEFAAERPVAHQLRRVCSAVANGKYQGAVEGVELFERNIVLTYVVVDSGGVRPGRSRSNVCPSRTGRASVMVGIIARAVAQSMNER